MTTYTKEQLNKILDLHGKWLRKEEGGVRANLSYVILRGVDLSGVYLCGADLSYANLLDANLREADLRGANLRGADLSRTDLRCADLSRTNLRDANLNGATLRSAILCGAILCGTNMWGTIGNGKEIYTTQTARYIINICEDRIQIGCKNHSYDEWMNFTDEEIAAMDRQALNWWKEHKDFVVSFYNIIHK